MLFDSSISLYVIRPSPTSERHTWFSL